MIEIKVSEAVEFLPSLKKVMKEKLSVKAAYRLSRIASRLDADLKLYEEKRIELVKSLGEQVGPGQFQVSKENLEKFKTELSQAGSEIIKIDLEPVTVDMLGNVQLEAIDLLALHKLIKDEA